MNVSDHFSIFSKDCRRCPKIFEEGSKMFSIKIPLVPLIFNRNNNEANVRKICKEYRKKFVKMTREISL